MRTRMKNVLYWAWLFVAMDCFLPTLAHSTSKRVVFIPFPSTSHARLNTIVAQALASQYGHQTWVAVPTSVASKGRLQSANVSFMLLHDPYTDFESWASQTLVNTYFKGSFGSVKEVLKHLWSVSEWYLSNSSFFDEIARIQPDLLVVSNNRPFAVIPYKLGIPFAVYGSHYDFSSARIPFSPAVVPVSITSFTDNMTFWQRLVNTLLVAVMYVHDPFTHGSVVSMYAPEKPFITNDMLYARAQLWLVETDSILDYPKPTLPNVKLIGGAAVVPAKSLSPAYQDFMDSSKSGVVLVTFGGSILGLPEDVSNKLFDVFRQLLPMKVVFRSNLTSPDPSKILTSTWLPQNDLLAHPNTKVFISHCGASGQYEALHHAVPLLCTPMATDEHYNARRIQVKGFGEFVDLRTVSAEEMASLVARVASTPSYKQAITKASRLFRQQYGVPSQEAAKWLDHVMEHGGQYMRFAGQEMPTYQFLLLDVLAFLSLAGLLLAGFLCWCVRLACRRCCARRKSKTE